MQKKIKSRKKSILFVSPWDIEGIGGVREVLKNLIIESKLNKKYNSYLLVPKWNEKIVVKINSLNIKTINMRLTSPWSSINPVKRIASYVCHAPFEIFRLCRIIRQMDVHAIYFHFPDLIGYSLYIAGKLSLPNVPLFLSFHGADMNILESGSLIEKTLWKMLVQKVQKIICCSEYLANRFIKIDEKYRNKTVWIHNGINIERTFKEINANRNYQILNGKRYIVNVGTFEHKKGQDWFLDAFTELGDVLNDLHVVLIGGSGSKSSDIKERIAHHKHKKRIVMLENLNHGKTLVAIQNADALILSSRKEPFGIVLLEAGVLKTPVIATAVGGIPEIIEDGINGILIDVGNVQKLIDSVVSLQNDKNKGVSLSENLLKDVKNKFSWNRAFEEYLEMVRN